MRAMTEQSQPSVPKWPFFLGDAFLLGVAWFVYSQSKLPLAPFDLGAICACVALGAFLGALPFILEYRIALKLAEVNNLASAVAQIQNLESIAAQINLATGLWQTVQAHSGKTVSAAKEIGDRMTSEAKAFADFMQKANDAEKGTLRLEVEKLRRVEADWVQVVVRMLDHTFALHTAAARTGKTALIEQLTQFQNALRDSARRVGLTPFAAAAGETFDAAKHQFSGNDQPESGATIGETLAVGYTLRGQLIRPALVTIAKPPAEASAPGPATTAPVAEEQTLL
jgi:molecular chaperone GrpE (heat shock protein)